MSLKRKMKKGFTLVELVVVIAVIAILSAVSVGAYFGITTSANNSAAEQEAKQVHTTIMLVVNKPDSGFTLNSTTGAIVFGEDEDHKTFVDAVEDMAGIEFVSVTKNAEGAYVKDDTDTTADIEKQGRIYIVDEATTFTYISTAGVEKTITLKTGAFVD